MLKPGGRFMCLEFSQVNNSLLRRYITVDNIVPLL